MSDLYKELEQVARALEGAGVAAALVGGMAYSIYVEPRATEDLDFLILPEDWERCIEALGPLGWHSFAAPMDFSSIRIRRLTKIEGTVAVTCDFLLADGTLREGVNARSRLMLGATPLYLAPPQVIIALKQARMSEKDRGDIEGLERFIRANEL